MNEKDTHESVPIIRAELISKLPDFASYLDVGKKKEAFFQFLRPMVREENARLDGERARLISLFSDYENKEQISEDDQGWLKVPSSRFRMNSFSLKEKMDRETKKPRQFNAGALVLRAKR